MKVIRQIADLEADRQTLMVFASIPGRPADLDGLRLYLADRQTLMVFASITGRPADLDGLCIYTGQTIKVGLFI